MWEHFDHQADIGVRGIGQTPGEAFAEAAVAMTAVVADPSRVNAVETVAIECYAAQTELLFVDWLNALIYEMDTRRMLFGKFSVSVDGKRLIGEACGELTDVARHQPAVHVKAATFSCLKVGQRSDGLWLAQCIVDV